MKLLLTRGLAATFLMLLLLSSRSQADPSPASADWNVTVLDQVLASVPAGQTCAQIGDMEIPVAYLQSWRNKLAGGPQPNLAFSGTFTKWPGGNVYYSFSNNVSVVKQKAFLDGMAEWAMFANLHFIPRTTQANYVTVFEAPALEGGQSMVGMVGGQQFLQIGPTDWNRPTICHELGHTLGLVHEQQRSDRNAYVTILTNNITPGTEGNFVLLTDSQNQTPYDFLSIMHYSRNAFAVNPALDTIEPLPAYVQYINVMGQQFDPVLSADDRAGMADVYGAGPALTNLVTNTADAGPGSLRAALYYAFDHPGTTITFNIPVTDPGYSNSVFNIQPSYALPGLWNDTTLDGSTQPTHSNPNGPQILLNGGLGWSLNIYPNGLRFRGTNSVARSFIINNFPNDGVLLDGSNTVGNIVSGCYLGTDLTGTIGVSNGACSLQISGGAVSNLVGGTTAASRNVIGGSFYQGLAIRDAGTRFNTVKGNYIGLDAAGDAPLPNTWSGVAIFNGAQSNLIGGYTTSARNVISGNNFQGVTISDTNSSGNVIAGNYIGLNAVGTVAVPNGTADFAGAEIFGGAQDNVIGGTAAGAGNVISGNVAQGVAIDGAGTSGNLVQGNLIGLNPAGNAALGNGWAGVNFFGGATGNISGGNVPGAGNVISGNGEEGVVFQDAGTAGNFAEGNFIGLNAAGTTAVSNGWAGVEFYSGAASNSVSGNVISGNGEDGVVFIGTNVAGNEVFGNYIGLDAAGTGAVGNGWSGVDIYYGPQNNLVGGNTPAARNVISGNGATGGDGVLLAGSGTTGNTIAGNFIGLNAAGSAAISNAWTGLELYNGAADNVIGGYGGARNFISGNGNYGVLIDYGSSGNVVQGNTIGLDVWNQTAIPNADAAVVMFMGAVSNLIGGVTPDAANLISGSTADGVQLFDAGTTNNTIRGNSIFGNNGLGIALYNSANQNLAAPTLTSAVVTTKTVVTGSYSGANGAVYQLDFYADAPPAFSAEAMTYLGARSITGTGGSAAFTVNLGALLPAGRIVTATVTDPAGNTSQLSPGVAATMISSVNDGIPDAWRALYFGGNGTTTNSLSYAAGDPDHDGANNYQEFLAGTNPTNAASVLQLTAFNPNTSTNVVSLNSANGIVYRVQYCDDLATGLWNLLADQIIGTGTNIFLSDPSATLSSERFYRAQVLW